MLVWLEEFILHAASQWWVLPVTGVLCLLDGLVPAFPSESVLVALAAIVRDGEPFALTALWAVGAFGAFCGDNLAYLIGRTVGTDRWRWMRTKAVAGAMGMARRNLDRRGAFLLFTARFVPGGRVAVNLTAGATRYSYLRFVLLDAVSCMAWSAYSILIARVTTGWLESPLAKIAVSLVGAFVVGLAMDRIIHMVLTRRERAAAGRPGASRGA